MKPEDLRLPEVVMGRNVFFCSVYWNWEKEKYILVLSNPLSFSCSYFFRLLQETRMSPTLSFVTLAAVETEQLSWMWSGEKKASCWDGYRNSVRKQVPHLGNITKKNMRMIFRVEGLRVCQVCVGRPIWPVVCCGLRHWWSIIVVVVDDERKFKEQSLVGKFSW